MTNFHEVQFPTDISRGSSGGPTRLTDIVTLRSGSEQRNSIWANSKHQFDAALGLRDASDIYLVKKFFEARLGRLYGFRWKDWSDFNSTDPTVATSNVDQLIGTGTGSNHNFQLAKLYSDAGGSYTRTIKKPVSGTTIISLNGVAQPSGWTVDTTTGIVNFTVAPTAGVLVKAGFEFDVPARFDDDSLAIAVEVLNVSQIQSIKIIEVTL